MGLLTTLIANFARDKKIDNGQNRLNTYFWDIYTEITYTYSTGKVVTIQNSGPRGGRGFTDTTGIKFGYRVFCTRVVNEADTPLELSITFPADSFPTVTVMQHCFMKIRDADSVLLSILLLFFAGTSFGQVPKSGAYEYAVAFAEWSGKSLGSTVTVLIYGDSIKVINN